MPEMMKAMKRRIFCRRINRQVRSGSDGHPGTEGVYDGGSCTSSILGSSEESIGELWK